MMTTKVLSISLSVAIAAGIIFGLLFENIVPTFAPIASTINMFLQMIIAFYIPLSLMHGITCLHRHETTRILSKIALFIIALWIATILSCLLSALFLPNVDPAMIDISPRNLDLSEKFLEYLIPSNFFYDAIHNILPPLAIFSLLIGIASMRSKNKEPLLDILEEGTHLIEKILLWIAYLAPLLAFLHMAHITSGTELALFSIFSFYNAITVWTSLFFALFFLPMFLSVLTPLRYRDICKECGCIWLMSFGTGQPLITIPLIYAFLKNTHTHYHAPSRDWQAAYHTVTPLALSFAQLGNILSLFLVFYFGYFFHVTLTPWQEILLPFFSVLLSIGSPNLTYEHLSILISEFRLPEQTLFYLRKLPNFILNFKMLFNASGIVCLISLIVMAQAGLVKRIGKKFLGFLLTSSCLFLGVCYVIHEIFPVHDYRLFLSAKRLNLAVEFLPQIQVSNPNQIGAITPPDEGTVLRKVLSQHKLVVGFDPDNAPYSYFDETNHVAGFDIAFMASLAYDLDVELELVPLNYETLETDLNRGLYDIAVGGIMVDFAGIQHAAFTDAYREDSNILMMQRANLAKYDIDLDTLKNTKGLRVGGSGAFVRSAHQLFPLAKIIPNTYWSDVASGKIDILFNDKTSSVTWALAHPKVVNLNFGDILGKESFSYALPLNDRNWKRFVNQWLSLRKLSGFYDTQYRYWFLSETP